MVTLSKFKARKGFSLLELLLVVAVGAVLILAGLGAYRLVSENNNTNQATRQLATLKQQVQQTFQGQSNYGAAGTDLVTSMDTMRALPPEMTLINATTIRGVFGEVNVTGQVNNFDITFNTVPRSSCIKLGQLFTPANSSDLVSLTINGGAVAAANFTLAGLTAACNLTTATNVMVWRFQ